MENQLQNITKRYKSECDDRQLAENTLKNNIKESKKLQTKLDSMFDELKILDEKVRLSEEEVNDWKDKYDKQKEEIVSMNQTVADANVINFFT